MKRKSNVFYYLLLLAVLLIIFFVIFKLIFPQNISANNNFIDTYSDKNTLDEFSKKRNNYSLKIEFSSVSVSLSLEKDNEDKWSGSLRYMSSEYEEIPIKIEDDVLVIQAVPEKKVAVKDVLFFENFDVKKFDVKTSSKDNFFESTEENTGQYPLDDIKPYMETFYSEVISCLAMFEEKDLYFKAISQLDSVKYKKIGSISETASNKMVFGFNGDEDTGWKPDYTYSKNISMLFTEESYYN